MSRDDLRKVHARVLDADPSAPAEVFGLLHKPLTRVVYGRLRIRGLSWEDAGDLATDAVVEYLSSPQKFDPDLASLLTYLAMIAWSDGSNLARKRLSEKKKFARLVELSAADDNNAEGASDAVLDARRAFEGNLDEIVENDLDRQLMKLILEGEQETTAYAKVLGITDKTEQEQQKLVKQHRDRLEKRLKRVGDKLR